MHWLLHATEQGSGECPHVLQDPRPLQLFFFPQTPMDIKAIVSTEWGRFDEGWKLLKLLNYLVLFPFTFWQIFLISPCFLDSNSSFQWPEKRPDTTPVG